MEDVESVDSQNDHGPVQDIYKKVSINSRCTYEGYTDSRTEINLSLNNPSIPSVSEFDDSVD